MERIV